MSDVIHLLPDSVANQIAAGEVIQRPASVVKELVENAIDAGASQIHVLITDAGKSCIQVVDNGVGMSETDARLSFERHATSKIREAADLFALHTMGFRGEALASIAAVAEVELKTRRVDDELGTRLLIAGCKVESQEPVNCPKGCNFSIKNLFFNVPARRKFLKANSTELSNILTEFERIALVHPDISFDLYSNDAEVFNLPATNLRQRIMAIFGKKMNQQLLTLDVDTSLIQVHGFVAKPDTSRKKGSHQYFFVNGRYMRHPYFHKAVMEAYERLIPAGEQVSYFIYFEVDPSHIDVNIHPTKTEIKFENEQAIWQILAAAVKETLGRFNEVPSIDFDTEDRPVLPAFSAMPQPITPPVVHYNNNFNPFDSSNRGSSPQRKPTNWEALYQAVPSNGTRLTDFPSEDVPDPMDTETFLTNPQDSQEQPSSATPPSCGASTAFSVPSDQGGLDFGEKAPVSSSGVPVPSVSGRTEVHESAQFQLKGRYILTSVKSGLMLIDQHRAHVRVLYDRYMEQIRRGHGLSQGVLFPEIVQLPPSQATVLESVMDEFRAVGFDLTSLGGGSYAIQGIPSGIEGLNPVELVRSMVHTVMEKGSDVRDEVHHRLALTLARAAAIVYGQLLSSSEMSVLINDLFSTSTPNYTPDGHIVLATIKEEEIEKLFK